MRRPAMSNLPATDEEIAVVRPLGYMCIGCDPKTPPETHGTACIFSMEPKLLARIESDRATIAELREKLSSAVEAAAVGEAVIAAVRGEPVSDFAESFGPVREAMELRAEVRRLEDLLVRGYERICKCPAGGQCLRCIIEEAEGTHGHEARAILTRREGK